MFGSSQGTDELRCYVDLDKNLFFGVSASSRDREKYFIFECVFFSSHGKKKKKKLTTIFSCYLRCHLTEGQYKCYPSCYSGPGVDKDAINIYYLR